MDGQYFYIIISYIRLFANSQIHECSFFTVLNKSNYLIAIQIMYVYFYTDYIEISTVVDFLTARSGIYYCTPEACLFSFKSLAEPFLGLVTYQNLLSQVAENTDTPQ